MEKSNTSSVDSKVQIGLNLFLRMNQPVEAFNPSIRFSSEKTSITISFAEYASFIAFKRHSRVFTSFFDNICSEIISNDAKNQLPHHSSSFFHWFFCGITKVSRSYRVMASRKNGTSEKISKTVKSPWDLWCDTINLISTFSSSCFLSPNAFSFFEIILITS